jgi:hypothetical protein
MQFVQTDMGAQINPRFVEGIGGFVAMDDVIKGKTPQFLSKILQNLRITEILICCFGNDSFLILEVQHF